MKRILVATLFGLVVAGGLCATGAFYFGLLKFSLVTLCWILLNRAVMGFAIGASGLKVHWALNGLTMGFAVGLIFSYFLFMTLGQGLLPIANAFVNAIFGLIVEFLTSVVCGQRAVAPIRALERTAAA